MGLKEYFKTNPRRALFVLMTVTLTQVMTTVYTYLTSPQLNAISQGKFNYFLLLLLVQFICGQICNVSFNVASVQSTKQTQALFHQVRAKILKHYYSQPTELSTMENNLGNDLQMVQERYFDRLFFFACDSIYVILTIGTLFTFHWLLVAYSLLITTLAIMVPKFFEKYTSAKTAAVSAANSKFLQTIAHWFQGLDELRRFEKKHILKLKIEQPSRDLEEKSYQEQRLMSYLSIVSGAFDILGRIGVPVIAGLLFYQHQVSLGAILTAGYFANGVFYTVTQNVNTYTELRSTKKLRDKLVSLQSELQLSKKVGIDQIETIRVQNLSVKYENNEVITYPDFSIKRGEKVLLTGDSGTGKSTLLKVILGQLVPETGQVTYLDKNNCLIKPNLAQVDYLAQDLIMFPGTIQDNITMFKPDLEKAVPHVVTETAFKSDQDKLQQGLLTKIDPEKNILSGGQRQKVVLMRTLIANKSWLLLDEATSAIDQTATTEILQTIVLSQATVMMVAHNLTPEQRNLFAREIHLERGQK
ncbi:MULTISPECIES: ABC transporter ATP-binding protein [Lactobacillus]|uniref:ABC transporter ATP-binding protein n=1 Tax=Lactobacillus xujianguonis TaxID=2495899 RepID=A0A437SXE0_9LACO|nr:MULTISPECIES: ABC transporter ATP-binding protein [Lactobacillus]RVU71589.1 ABC transporter ATP-binding protein [Lactobacillus xujianguonis]RVU77759.1 ABC transporter ATP-binding protein [Lactobacillus xujianguonis]